jgi:hypothetical protein
MSSPAPIVEDLGHEMLYMQLSNNHLDVINHSDDIENVRRRVKQHLNNNAFFNPMLGLRHDYNVPQFTFIDGVADNP